jgi:TonB family protein
MKAVRNLVLIIAANVSSAFGASAASPEQEYLATCCKDPRVPVPISVVSPAVGPQYDGASVRLEFIVAADGKPAQFTIKSAPDDIVAGAVVHAVKQWRFQPAEIDGKPVAMKVLLPVNIVESAAAGARYAARQ